MMIAKTTRLHLVCLLSLAGMLQTGLASPTSNEFERCDDMRDASFSYCMELKTNPPPNESACRTRSQEMKEACYRQVNEQYRKPSADELAKRKSMAREAERRAAQAVP